MVKDKTTGLKRVSSWESTTDPLEERFRAQSNLEKDEKVSEKMRMHFNKYEVADYEMCQPHIHIYICEADKRHKMGNNWRGSESSEKDLRIIMDHKLNTSQEYFAFERKQISKGDI